MSDFERLLDVQHLDTRGDQLRHRLTHDPLIAALADAEVALVAAERALSALKGQADEVRSVQRRHERAVEDIEAKIARVNATLYGGTVTAPKELEGLQHEIGTLTGLRDAADDLVLEQMELAEPLTAGVAEATAEVTQRSAALEAARQAVTVMQAEVGVELDDVALQREAAAVGFDDALLARYERIRSDLGGTAVARLGAGGKCEGCHLSLARAEYDQIKRAPTDEVVACPECGRILVR